MDTSDRVASWRVHWRQSSIDAKRCQSVLTTLVSIGSLTASVFFHTEFLTNYEVILYCACLIFNASLSILTNCRHLLIFCFWNFWITSTTISSFLVYFMPSSSSSTFFNETQLTNATVCTMYNVIQNLNRLKSSFYIYKSMLIWLQSTGHIQKNKMLV